MKLSSITEKTPLVKDFVKQLAKATKQAIPIVDIGKVGRVSGASMRPVTLALENGQTVKFYIRVVGDDDDLHYDIGRIDINGTMQPLAGDYDNSYKPAFNASVDMLGASIRQGQGAFDKKRAKIKVVKPRTGKAPMNSAQQRNAVLEEVKSLDDIITEKTAEKTALTLQLEKLTA